MNDKDAIIARSWNVAMIAVAEWEMEHRAFMTQHERELFAYAFHRGMVHGVLEAGRVIEET